MTRIKYNKSRPNEPGKKKNNFKPVKKIWNETGGVKQYKKLEPTATFSIDSLQQFK
jgi:hypothetical protein